MSSISLALTLNRQDHLSLQHHLQTQANLLNNANAGNNNNNNNNNNNVQSYSGKLGSTDANLYLDKLTALETAIQAQKQRIRYFVFSAPFIGENAQAGGNANVQSGGNKGYSPDTSDQSNTEDDEDVSVVQSNNSSNQSSSALNDGDEDISRGRLRSRRNNRIFEMSESEPESEGVNTPQDWSP